MIETSGRLIDTAVTPLADNAELQLAAAALLEEAVGKPVGNADEVIARWEEVDANKTRPWMKWGFIAVLVALSAWAWTVAAREGITCWRLSQVSDAYRYMPDDYAADRQKLENCIPWELGRRERLLLFGDTSKDSLTEGMKGLWDSEPENPAFFMEYVLAHWMDHRCPPTGFLETARRLDPQNSWLTYFAAAANSSSAVKAEQQSSADRGAWIPGKWVIRDQAKFDELLALIHQAAAQPEFDTYQVGMLRLRMPLVPMDDQLGYLTSVTILWQESPQEFFGGLIHLVAAKSQQCAEQGDKAGFQALLKDFEVLEKRWADSETDSMLAEVRICSSFRKAVPNLLAAADTLGLAEETARFAAIRARFEKQREESNSNRAPSPYNRLERHYPMLLAEMRAGFQEFPHPPWTVEALKPGRLADHELLSRACCLVAWIIFGLGLGLVALFRFRLPVLLRRLSARIGSLLRPADYAWMIGIGILLPYGFTMVVNRLTPLGGRELGVFGMNGLLPSVQFLGMVLLMLITPVLVARWRLGKRGALFGLGGGEFGFCGRAAVCAAVFIPVSGWVAAHEFPEMMYWLPLAGALIVFPVLWLFVSSLLALSGTAKMRLLTHGVIARALVPVYAVAMLLMAAAAPFHKAAQRHWFRKDTVVRMNPAFPAMSPYEYQAAQQFREQTRRILGLGG